MMVKIPNKDIFGWDVYNYSMLLREIEKSGVDFKGKKVLEVGAGCKNGGLTAYFASMGAIVECSDYTKIEQVTKNIHKKYNLDVKYSKKNILDLKSVEQYDIICFKSVIGGVLGHNNGDEAMLKDIFKQLHTALKPNGMLIFSENLTGSKMIQFLRRLFIKWNYYWVYQRQSTLEEMTQIQAQKFHIEVAKTNGVIGVLGRTVYLQNILGLVDNILCPIVPKKWHYIYHGIYKKK